MTRKIVTDHVWPPIPVRTFDWSAVYEGYEPGNLIGYGRTKAEAIADLQEQDALAEACAALGGE